MERRLYPVIGGIGPLGIEEKLARAVSWMGRAYPLRRGQGRFIQTSVYRRLARSLPDELTATTKSGVKIRVAPADYLGRLIYFFGEHERRNAQVLEALLPGKEVFWDIGANYGLFSLEMAFRFPRLKVLSVEPQPRLQRMLRESKALNGLQNISIHAGAVSDSSGQMTLYIPEESLAVASLAFHHPRATELSVPVTTLDELARKHESPQVIKMDVEGAESDAIRGGRTLLNEVGPAILLEANEARTQPLGDSQAIRELSNLGYQFFQATKTLDIPCPLEQPLKHGHDIVALKA